PPARHAPDVDARNWVATKSGENDTRGVGAPTWTKLLVSPVTNCAVSVVWGSNDGCDGQTPGQGTVGAGPATPRHDPASCRVRIDVFVNCACEPLPMPMIVPLTSSQRPASPNVSGT